MKATQALREQNAAFQAETRARLTTLERRDEDSGRGSGGGGGDRDAGAPRGLSAFVAQVGSDWRTLALIVAGVGEAVQLIAPHVALHW